jgi:hypothetical protein
VPSPLRPPHHRLRSHFNFASLAATQFDLAVPSR